MSKKVIALLLLLVLFSGCSQGNTNPLPMGTTSPAFTVTIPAAGQDTGVVVGRLFSTKMNAPLSNVGAYLGDYIAMTPGPNHMVSMSQQNSPHGMTDADGNFVIDKVPPGKYPLLAWTPFTSYVVPDASGKNELVVEVIASQVTKLGEIQINWP